MTLGPEPKILYKYKSLSGDNFKFTHDIFMKDRLYFPHPDQINDPFDCILPLNLENLTKDDVKKWIEKADPNEVKKRGYDFDDWKHNLLRASITEIKNDLRQRFKRLREVGVLSFSKKYKDILMWGHYTVSHKGICIGFDRHELCSTFGEIELFMFGDVEYPDNIKYPEWNPYAIDINIKENYEFLIKITYFTKSTDWIYEKEWRVVLPKQGRSLQKINPNAIVSVYLGCQIDPNDRETVINWCLQREPKPKVYEMTKSKTSYSLEENEISY
jgi:hypothetical protein